MNHEPECAMVHDQDWMDYCICEIVRAAYQRGREAAAKSIIDNVSHAEDCRQEPDPYWACDCGVSLCVAFARTDNPFAAHGESERSE